MPGHRGWVSVRAQDVILTLPPLMRLYGQQAAGLCQLRPRRRFRRRLAAAKVLIERCREFYNDRNPVP
jgi:hypothetical protein